MRTLHRPRARGATALLLARLSLGAAGCTLLFDPDDLRPGGGGPGPVDPNALELFALSPAAVDEGAVVVRPVPVVIQGRNIAADAMVRLSGPSQDATLRPLQVASNGTLAAFEVAIPVQPALADGATGAVLVEVFQGDGVTRSLTLVVNGLDELVATQFGPSHAFTLVSEDLKQSQILVAVTVNKGYTLGKDDKPMPEEAFKAKIAEEFQRNSKAPVVIKADARLTYGDVKKAMAIVKDAGFEAVGLIAEKEHR